MPTLPLFQSPLNPEAWHQVNAPGGYEGFYFDAEDFSAGIRLVGFLGEGCRFEGNYRREYYKYRKRPTVNAPPVPADYPGFELVLFRGGRLWAACRSAGEGLEASVEQLAVGVGGNRLMKEGEGYRLRLLAEPFTWTGERGAVEGELVFRPRGRARAEGHSFSPQTTGAAHSWTVGPFCDVEGMIVCGGESVAIKGRGCLEHRFGVAPIELDIRRGLAGRVLLEDRALMFHMVQPRDKRLAERARLIEVSDAGVRELAVGHRAVWKYMRSYPAEVSFGEELRIVNPRGGPPGNFVWFDARMGRNAGSAVGEML